MLVDLDLDAIMANSFVEKAQETIGRPFPRPVRLGKGLYTNMMMGAYLLQDVGMLVTEYPYDPLFDSSMKDLDVDARLKRLREIWEEDRPDDHGVCDYPEQVVEVYPKIQTDLRPLVILFNKCNRQDGTLTFRWHKQGPYIGTQNPRYEHARDDGHIDTVWLFSVVQVTRGK
jgi:hypothetical protein